MASINTPIEQAGAPAASEEALTTVYEAPDRPVSIPAPGTLIAGAYELQDAIGEGGMGSVHRALHRKLGRSVAIKFLQRDTLGEMDLRARFEREAMALAAMRHPNIVRFHDYGIDDGRPYLVMDLVDGRTLLDLLKAEGALPVARAVALTRQLLYALAYAHDRGLVHRDLKSANVMVQALSHQPEHVTILDFGFVKLLPGHRVDGAAPLTRAGVAFGSPPYISPEQATGGDIDGRADLYSVGVLLFEMLTGTRPFDGAISDVLRHHLASPVPKLAARNTKLTGRNDLQALIERAMAKSRSQRFANADAMLAALDAVDRKPATTAISSVLDDTAFNLKATGRRLIHWIAATAAPALASVLWSLRPATRRIMERASAALERIVGKRS